jgi:hypothetical protein
MSMTLETLWSLHGWATHHDVSQSVDILARRGGGRRSTHFFFFGGGAGSALLAVPLLIISVFGGYLMRNPDKARGLKERLKGGWGAAAAGLNSGAATSPGPNGQLPYASPNSPSWWANQNRPPHGSTPAPPSTSPLTSIGRGEMRFNSPPGWPVPPDGWTPTPEWRPDPSWPPAPPGWQFWLRQGRLPGGTTPSLRKRLSADE